MEEQIFEKMCTGPCGRLLPLSEFAPRKEGKHGRRGECRKCQHDYRTEYGSRPGVAERRLEKERDRRTKKIKERKAAEEALKKLPFIGPIPDRRCKGPCGRVLPLTSFDYHNGGKFKRRSVCRFCNNIYQCERYRKDPKSVRRYRKTQRVKNVDKLRSQDRVRRKEPWTREKKLAGSKAWREKLKVACFEAYGGFCTCCGETDFRLLTLDHVNQDGAEHRKLIKAQRAWTVLYQWAKQNGYPPSLRILCWTCNNGAFRNKANLGVCPHQEEFNIIAMARDVNKAALAA